MGGAITSTDYCGQCALGRPLEQTADLSGPQYHMLALARACNDSRPGKAQPMETIAIHPEPLPGSMHAATAQAEGVLSHLGRCPCNN